MPGSADKAFFPTHANIRPREASFYFTHSFAPPLLEGSAGIGVEGAPLLPPLSAKTSVEIARPIAVNIENIVTPCS